MMKNRVAIKSEELEEIIDNIYDHIDQYLEMADDTNSNKKFNLYLATDVIPFLTKIYDMLYHDDIYVMRGNVDFITVLRGQINSISGSAEYFKKEETSNTLLSKRAIVLCLLIRDVCKLIKNKVNEIVPW